ncbi:SGNH/GDSL hydrolase family protein [uncultured Microbacterium sp.]|uniref:SGNH/GDSL hydrolase family protein n=1 Tax=uncultured Microbacterium sp. TaxID=191216 RepID=UPI0028D7A6AC|nr:SGNH/GDSL hydrolase family protein [uncultured Microbacterium sp.]
MTVHPLRWLVAVAAMTTTTMIAGPAFAAPALAPGDTYVALGSSYAAGGGLGPADPAGLQGCGRTTIAYPYLVAEALDLQLTNAACGGASIDNVAGTPQQIWGWDGTNRLGPLQLDAVHADTDVVTITIGGNDVNYVGNLTAEACLGDLAANPASVISNQLKSYGLCSPRPDSLVRQQLDTLQDSLVRMVQDVRGRAPQARIVLVDYISVLPENGKPCAALPIPQDRQKFLLEVARKVSLATKLAAHETGVELVAASKLSRGHDACSTEPWVIGYDFSQGFVMMHPNATGHAAVADAVVRQLNS